MFRSTRGLTGISFSDAVLSGWASDGGMLLPQEFPTFSSEELEVLRGLTYPALAYEILQRFVDPSDVPHEDLRRIVCNSLECFAIPEILQLHALAEGIYVCDLWHGPSLAFKDLGMCVLCSVLDYLLAKRHTHMKVLVGTSGDTGPSALQAINSKRNMSLIVLYPLGRVSEAQELQMLSAEDISRVNALANSQACTHNLRVVGVEGTSDDLDRPIEHILKNVTPTQTLQCSPAFILGSVNSVNVLRVLVQTVHLFWCYFRLTSEDSLLVEGEKAPEPPKISFSIPTGAGGHVTAAVWAKVMGLPLHKIVVATNQNDVLTALLEQGTLRRLAEVKQTPAPAMDIQVPYNVERLFFMATGGEVEVVVSLMTSLHSGEEVTISPGIRDFFLTMGLCAQSVSNEDILRTLDHTYKAGRLQDPHTCVGVCAAMRVKDSGPLGPIVCMGCAHPAKFLPSVHQALYGGEGIAPTAATIAQDDYIIDALPGARTHPHVSKLLDQLRQLEKPRPKVLFTKDEDWESQLLSLVYAL